jgi:hypothetical protein
MYADGGTDIEIVDKSFPSVTKLEIHIDYSLTLTHLLNIMPNLRHLIVDTGKSYLNGHAWKQIIMDHLCSLKVLEFRMESPFRDKNKKEEEVDDFLDTFRALFWLNEHRWFVRCEWNSADDSDNMQFYTLPYRKYRYFCRDSQIMCKSTCPDDRDYCSFDSVYDVYFSNNVDDDWSKSSLRFPKVASLNINLPAHESIWLIIPTLDHLTSLDISTTENLLNLTYKHCSIEHPFSIH